MLTLNTTFAHPASWVDRFFDDFDRNWGYARRSGFTPAVDITEEKDAFVLRAELPGVAKENLTVEIKDNQLVLSGRKEAKVQGVAQGSAQGEEGRYRYVESRSGEFSRTFELPRNVKTDAIEAEHKDGVLQLRIPKADEARPKTIAIK